jgi:hypothetical protein
MGWFGQLHLEVDGIGPILASVIRFYSQKNKRAYKILEASGQRPMMMNFTRTSHFLSDENNWCELRVLRSDIVKKDIDL